MPDALNPAEASAGTTASPTTGMAAAVDAVFFESDGVRVTTRHVEVRGRSWGLEHVCGVTTLLQPPTDRLLRVHAVFAGALLLVYGLVQGPLEAFRGEGSPGSVVFSVAALLGYAVLSWRVLLAERAYVWVHTRFSSQLVYRGHSSTTARALAFALHEAQHQRGQHPREADDAREDSAQEPA